MPNKSLKQIFFWPSVIGILSLVGLVLALVRDGLFEDLSLAAIALPITVILYKYYFRH